MSNVQPKHLSSDKDEFRNCVIAVFSNWSALQLAVDHGMGGSPQESNQKVTDMADVVTNMCFSTNTSDWGDIAAELEDLMDSYFDTILEDESPDVLGQLLWDLSRKWLAGDKESTRNYIANLKTVPVKNHVKSQPTAEVSEQMETVEEDSTEPTSPIAQDVDGWTVVTRSRQRNH